MATTPVDADEVRTIAHLARLRFDDDTVRRLGVELADMLELVGALADADLDGVEPMLFAGTGSNRLAEDEPGATLSAEQVARLAPDSESGMIRVPRVLDSGKH
ncbi:MAG TPA: Asp-tRNA(Asn)/Glu-tRNA(Gln) amidotransferase subunit GatC [Phycisphaerales bacterium]|nr:Asp-tRNA(Asn)/Glu-tRNA(Gln) amidotransferase subunit GatC [Phycisphaerales bacterium]